MIGMTLLSISTFLCFLQVLLPNLKSVRQKKYGGQFIETLTLSSAFLITTAFFALIYAFVSSDLSTLNVALNSHQATELLYKISGAWGSHEGSMLLWLTLLTVVSGVFVLQRKIPKDLRFSLMAVMGFISFCFHLFVLLTSNPFVQLYQVPKQGMGLNPLLEDPALAIHPPILYTGLALLSVLFSFTCAALSHKILNEVYAKIMRVWALLCWCFLTTGIAFGSWWAYYELGWGGWWFWDPVENLSLLPWLMVTAFIHSLSSFERYQNQKTLVAFLGMGGFLMALLTLFLVRSGFLSSVHAFAVDPLRGSFLAAIFFLILGYSLYLLIRFRNTNASTQIHVLTREAFIFMNTLFLLCIFGLVLLGTLYPLLLNRTTGILISVGAPYFNQTTLPFFLGLILLMTAVPFLQIPIGLNKSYGYVITLCLGALLGIAYLKTGWPIMALLFFTGAMALLWACVFDMMQKLWKRQFLSLRYVSMTLAHTGIAVLVLGAVLDTSEKQEKTMVLKEKEPVDFHGFQLALKEVNQIRAPYFQREVAHVLVERQGKNWLLLPEKRFYPLHEMITSETSIQSAGLGDLYMILGDQESQTGWLVKVQWHPAIHLLWLGATFLVLAGFLGFIAAMRKMRFI